VIWDVATGNLLSQLKAHSDKIVGVAFTRDNVVVTASWDGTLKSWNVPDLTPATSVKSDGAVASVVITDDLLITGDWDGRIAVWSLSPLRQVKRWRAHRTAVTSLAYDAQTRIILSGSRDRAIALWDTSGQLIRMISSTSLAASHSEFSPDGGWFMINAGGTEVQLWRGLGTLAGLVDEARRYLVRQELSDAERELFSVTTKVQKALVTK
jgi:WD40 repeat protein